MLWPPNVCKTARQCPPRAPHHAQSLAPMPKPYFPPLSQRNNWYEQTSFSPPPSQVSIAQVHFAQMLQRHCLTPIPATHAQEHKSHEGGTRALKRTPEPVPAASIGFHATRHQPAKRAGTAAEVQSEVNRLRCPPLQLARHARGPSPLLCGVPRTWTSRNVAGPWPPAWLVGAPGWGGAEQAKPLGITSTQPRGLASQKE